MEILLTTVIVGFFALTTGYGVGWLDGFKTGCKATDRPHPSLDTAEQPPQDGL